MHLETRVPAYKLLKYLTFLNLDQYAKNLLSSSIHSSIQLVISVPQPLLTTSTPIFFDQLLIFGITM